jgi:hypothetical protein
MRNESVESGNNNYSFYSSLSTALILRFHSSFHGLPILLDQKGRKNQGKTKCSARFSEPPAHHRSKAIMVYLIIGYCCGVLKIPSKVAS